MLSALHHDCLLQQCAAWVVWSRGYNRVCHQLFPINVKSRETHKANSLHSNCRFRRFLNLLLDNVLIGQATAEMENVSSSSVVLYNKASIKWFWAISRFSIFGGLGQSPSIYEKLKQIHASLQKYVPSSKIGFETTFHRILPFFVVPLSPKFEHPNHRIIQVANWWCIAIPEIQNHPVVSSVSPFHPQKTVILWTPTLNKVRGINGSIISTSTFETFKKALGFINLKNQNKSRPFDKTKIKKNILIVINQVDIYKKTHLFPHALPEETALHNQVAKALDDS